MCRLMVSTLASLLSCKLSEPSGKAPSSHASFSYSNLLGCLSALNVPCWLN